MASSIPQQPAQQRSAAEEFDTRMLNIVSRLEMTDTIFFYWKVSKSMVSEAVQGPIAYSLEFPHDFLIRHRRKFDEDVTFVTPDGHQTWPIKVTVRTFKDSRDRVFAYGHGGWQAFLMDNHIKVGDVLIFKLLKFSCFEVHIGRSPVEVHLDDNKNADQANADEDNAHQGSLRFVVTICRPCEPEHPENHFYLEKDLSLVVPSHFWELHSRMLEGDVLRLKGPTKTITTVKVERTYNGEVQKVRLMHSGWKAFLVANNLAIGDILEFSLVANSSFIVTVVEQIKNH